MAAFYVQFLARPAFLRLRSSGLQGYADKLPVLVYRVLLTALGLGLTVVIAGAVGLFFYEDHQATQLTVITVFATYAAVVQIDTIWRMALAPFLPGCRLPEIGDDEARRLYRWLTLASGFGVIASAFCYWVLGLGLAREVLASRIARHKRRCLDTDTADLRAPSCTDPPKQCTRLSPGPHVLGAESTRPERRCRHRP